jgi:hypothetical protein
MSFTHTEKQVIRHILKGQMVPMDLRKTRDALQARGDVVRTRTPRGFEWTVSDAANRAVQERTDRVDPLRVNVNSGKLLDDERDAKDEPWRNKNFKG